jgi:hypothetical protein
MPRLLQSKEALLRSAAGVGIIILSFWLTLLLLRPSSTEPIRSKVILIYGDTSSSNLFLDESSTLQFAGAGHAELQDTNALKCLELHCYFSLKVSFGSAASSETRLIVGQSRAGESGWHLLWAAGRLVLQTEGGANQIDALFEPKVGQRYKIEISQQEHDVRLAVDGIALTSGKTSPLTDTPRNITFGGRPAPGSMPFIGSVTDVQIKRLRPPP